MPCWVAPVIAAELWGVSLEQVLCAIADGTLPSQVEYGFTVVNVAPVPLAYQPPRRPGQPAPPTYVLVDELPPQQVPAEPVSVRELIDEGDSAELPPLDNEEDDTPIGNWRDVRSKMGRMRRPPKRTPPLAA